MSKKNPANTRKVSRRDFINTSALMTGAAIATPWIGTGVLEEFPISGKLGRIATGMVDIKIRPDYDAPNVGTYYEDKVIPWLREVVGPWPFR